MDRDEAKKLLSEELNSFATRRYDELKAAIDQTEVKTLTGASGVTYQIEIDVVWDSEPNGACESSRPSTTAAGARLYRSPIH
jgi:hypothetical protein